MAGLQKVGEHLRFGSALAAAPVRVRHLARRQALDAAVRVDGARAFGDRRGHAAGDHRCPARRHPAGDDERRRSPAPRLSSTSSSTGGGVSDALYRDAVGRLGEQRVLDLIGRASATSPTISMVLNVARTPAGAGRRRGAAADLSRGDCRSGVHRAVVRQASAAASRAGPSSSCAQPGALLLRPRLTAAWASCSWPAVVSALAVGTVSSRRMPFGSKK